MAISKLHSDFLDLGLRATDPDTPPAGQIYIYGIGTVMYARFPSGTIVAFSPPAKGAGTDVDTGTNDALYLTAKALNDSHNVPDVAPGTAGNILQSDGIDYKSVPHPKLAGDIVQSVTTLNKNMNTYSTALPRNDTIPESNEGDNMLLDTAITPKSASNNLHVRVVLNCSVNAANDVVAALFRDAAQYAVNVSQHSQYAANAPICLVIEHEEVAGSTSATTFKCRAGSASGTLTRNGINGGRFYGGVLCSSMTVTEIQV